MRTFGYLFLIASLFLCCDTVIQPSLPSSPRLVVFSILSTQSDTQFVRVYSSYQPPENNPSLNLQEHAVDDATVSVSDGFTTYSFRYASIPRPDTGRYKDNIGVYYAYPFRPEENKEYTLSISSPSFGQATSKTRVPGRGRVECITLNELYYPSPSPRPIYVQYQLSDLTQAQLVRFYIVYTTENPGDEGIEHYYEVPVFWRILDLNYELHGRIFPTPERRTARLTRRGQPVTMTLTFAHPTYPESQYEIFHYNFNVRFKRAVFYLVQFDENWYKYYAAVNLFQDPLAVRLDQPDFTNIRGGSGVFGSFRVDSSIVPLPEYIRPYR